MIFGLLAHGFHPAFQRGHWWLHTLIAAVGTSLYLALQYAMISFRREGFVFNELVVWRILALGPYCRPFRSARPPHCRPGRPPSSGPFIFAEVSTRTMKRGQPAFRILFIAALMLLALAGITFRLWYVQIARGRNIRPRSPRVRG